MIKYYFTKSHQATKKEASEAKRFGCVLVNGMFADSFNKPCDQVYGNYPNHLKHKYKQPRRKKVDGVH